MSIEPGYLHVPDPNVGLRRMLRAATLLADAMQASMAAPNEPETGWGEEYFAQFMGTPPVAAKPRPQNPTNPTRKSDSRIIRVDV